MKHIVSLSLGSPRHDYVLTTTVLGQQITIQRIGVDGDAERAVALVQEYDGYVDVLSFAGHITPSGTRPLATAPLLSRMTAAATLTPVVDGSVLRGILERWAIKRSADQKPGLYRYRRVLFLDGLQRYPMAQALAAYDTELRFADPLLAHSSPLLRPLSSLNQLDVYGKLSQPVLNMLFGQRHSISPLAGDEAAPTHDEQRLKVRLKRQFEKADILVGPAQALLRLAPDNLRGRVCLTDELSAAEVEAFKRRNLATLITMTPPLDARQPFVGFDVLEALIVAVQELPHGPDEANVLDFITAAHWHPHIQALNPEAPRPLFAFVIHPLVTNDIYNDPDLRFGRYLPQRLVEWVAAFAPPLYLSRIRGIRSTTTNEPVEGVLLTLASTSREMMRRSPESTYRRLEMAARKAERMGARVMGLGAFTSVVGDAGLTVAQRCEIGMTTGNSLTVAATLETIRLAMQAMGGQLNQGRAMILGATGSIGAACARLLAMETGNVVLVAPRPEKLLALKQQIEDETPGVHVVATTNPNTHLHLVDLVVLATSALTTNLIAMDNLKPGAVVCDVARPPNIGAAEAEQRPDVLFIESGEIHLPGEPDLGFNINLPPGSAYACLAETAVLAMDGRFADYTLGRTIDPERVQEMHYLMKKHGLKLAGLRSFGHDVTGEMLATIRQQAEARRMHPASRPDTARETLQQRGALGDLDDLDDLDDLEQPQPSVIKLS